MLTAFRRYLDHYRRFGVNGVSFLLDRRRPDTELIQLKLKGYHSPITLRNGTSDISTFYKIFYYKEYDVDLKISPKVIIDCGANIGLSSIFYSHKYPNAKIFAVEPEKSNFELLKINSEGYPNITCLNYAIWNTQTMLSIEDGYDNWGFRTTESDETSKSFVPAVSVGYIMEKYQIQNIDILKVDIEGSEKELFEKNFETWLPKTKAIIIELHDHTKRGCSKSLFGALSNYDYVLSASGENFICELLKYDHI